MAFKQTFIGFSSHWQPFNFGWSNCLSLKHVLWLLSFSILLNIFRILAILFQKLAKTGGLEWLSHYNCRLYYLGIIWYPNSKSTTQSKESADFFWSCKWRPV